MRRGCNRSLELKRSSEIRRNPNFGQSGQRIHKNSPEKRNGVIEMARTKTLSGEMRDLTNEIASTVKVLEAPVMERQLQKDANAAAPFVEGLRAALLDLQTVIAQVADTYRVELDSE